MSSLPMKDKVCTLSSYEAQFLCEVIKQADITLTNVQWENIAAKLDICNGKAAKTYFEDFMKFLAGRPKPKKKKEQEAEKHSSGGGRVKPVELVEEHKRQFDKGIQTGIHNLDGTTESFKEAEERMSIDELLLLERED